MPVSKKAVIVSLAAAGLWLAPLLPAAAGEHERMGPVKDPAVIKECGACHMAFQPGFLPARSWQKMMGGLKDHFGENAEIDEATAKHITEYLTANAGSAGWLSAGETPLSISETPWFKRKHEKRGRTSPETMKRRGAKSVADCVACHRDAARGYYEDD